MTPEQRIERLEKRIDPLAQAIADILKELMPAGPGAVDDSLDARLTYLESKFKKMGSYN